MLKMQIYVGKYGDHACNINVFTVCFVVGRRVLAKRVLFAGTDLGFSERGDNHSSGSLKQGVRGHSPPKL